MTRIIATDADVAEGLAHLAAVDPRLAPVIAAAGKVPLRRSTAGFPGLARIVTGQQLSVASAEAIWKRVAAALPQMTPQTLLAAADAILKAAGLSAAKIRTLRAVAEAAIAGLDLDALAERPADEAHAAMTAIHGIGPWTADIYLLFALGHSDIFPAGDLALRTAVATGLGLKQPPGIRELATIAGPWSPWRGVAAALFWAYYRTLRSRAATPV
jgi:DNA-3-methyladenine glycosylase II